MYTVGKLARRHGLSRSTLLYYDRIGLFSPTGHSPGEYRRYSTADDARLARICRYRRAGLPLADIGRILADPAESGLSDALETRLAELGDEMAALREQQALVAELLGRPELLARRDSLDRESWSRLLREVGFAETDMDRWHEGFEQASPEGHAAFLRRLRMPEEEIAAIRSRACAPHLIFNLNKESGSFMKLFFAIHEGLEREGPGSRAMTRRALALCAGLPENPAVLDIGCGSGAGTLDLAELSGGSVVAVDMHQPFLDRLAERAAARGLSHRVTPAQGDMAALGFEPGSFDLVWSEGAAYIMGVDNALARWRPLLRPDGFLVISDAVWLADPVPDEMRAFWAEAYPAMRRAEDIDRAARTMGYRPLGRFTLDAVCWDDFYTDLARRMDVAEGLWGRDPDGRAIIDATRREIELYWAYPGAYGYEFHAFAP
ncbi:MAG: MerR family transcriptional regulator [Pseudomonadota bacterium]